MTTKKIGKVYGSNVQIGDVWLREGTNGIKIKTIKPLGNGNVLVNGCWQFVCINRYRVERTYS